MNRCAAEGGPDEVDARAELILGAIGLQLVVAQAVIEHEGIEHFPFVLNVDADGVGGLLRAVIDNGGYIRRRITVRIQDENVTYGTAFALVGRGDQAGANRVVIVDGPSALGLEADRSVLLVGGLGHTVESQFGIPVRRVDQL